MNGTEDGWCVSCKAGFLSRMSEAAGAVGQTERALSTTARVLVLWVSFAGLLFDGVEMG